MLSNIVSAHEHLVLKLNAFRRIWPALVVSGTVWKGVWGAMEPKTNVSLTTSAQSLLPRQFPRLIFRTFRKYC